MRIFGIALLIGILFTISVQAERISIPRGVFYYEPASSVFGSEAVWINPAGLSLYRASGFQVMADYYDGKYAKSWGTIFNHEGFGIGYRKVHNPSGDDYKEYLFSGGMKIGRRLNFGLEYQKISDGPLDFPNLHLWNIGLIGQSGPKYKWGVIFSNLNRVKINDIKTETEMRYSLAYRPHGKILTLAADMMLSTGTKIRKAEFIYAATVNPAPGWYINGYYDSNKNFELGVRVNIMQTFIGSRRTGDRKGNNLGTTFFYGGTTIKQESVKPHTKRVLNARVSGRPSENPIHPFIGPKSESYLTMLLDLYRAADDPSIDVVVLNLDKLSLGFSQAQELRTAITYFKSKKKRSIAYLNYPNNIAYYVGSICDELIIPPVSQLNLVGLRVELTFYGGTMEKLGVDADILRIGKYKTAPESYTRDSSTDENKEQINRYLDNIYEQFTQGIAEGRHITADSVKRIIDNGPYTSIDAYRFGLVDTLLYYDEIEKSLQRPSISLSAYHSDTLINESWETAPTLAVLVAGGEIQQDNEQALPFSSSSTDVTPQKAKQAVGQIKRDPDIAGVILRINSPGGDALAGEDIYHDYKSFDSLFVSMGNIAASGGYYIGMAGSSIFANPGTVTGSIGIFGGKADLSKLYDKISLGKELYTRGRFAGMMSTTRPFTDEEREKYFSQLQGMYDHFVSLVAENRNLPADSIDNLSRGRIWTGSEAKKNGLVDQIGGLKETIDFAAQRLNLKDYRVKIYPEKRPLFILPGNSLFSSAVKLFTHSEKSKDLEHTMLPFESTRFYTRLPYDIYIE